MAKDPKRQAELPPSWLRWPPWLLALLLAAPAAWLVLQQGVYVGNGTDLFSYQIPLRAMVAGQLRSGHWPAWNPFELAGVPAHAGMQLGLAYPPDLALPVLLGQKACDWLLWLHLVWLAAGAWRLALAHVGTAHHASGWRALLPAAVAAAILVGSGPTWGHVFAGHVSLVQAWAWLPWIWTLAIGALRTRQLRPLLLAMAALGAQVLAGHPQVTYLTLAGLCFVLLGHALEPSPSPSPHPTPSPSPSPTPSPTPSPNPNPWHTRWQHAPGSIAALAVLLALVLGGLLLSALQWLPTAAIQHDLNRQLATPEDIAFAWSAPARTLWTAVAPAIWGRPGAPLGDLPYHETLAFVGAAALALALLGVFVGGWRAWLALAGVAFCLGISLGDHGPLLPALLGLVPGIGSFRVPGRWLLPAVVLVALLAAQGLHWLLQKGERRPLAVPPWLAAGGLGLAALAWFLAGAGVQPDTGWWAEFAGGSKLSPATVQDLASGVRTDFTWAALACAAVALACLKPAWRPGAGVALAALALAQSLGLGTAHVGPAFLKPGKDLAWSPSDRAILQQAVGSRHRLATGSALRHANWGGQAGVAVAGGYEPAVTVQANRYGNLLAGRAIDGYGVNFQVRKPSPWLDRLAVSHVLLGPRDRGFADWPEVARLDGGLILRSHPHPFDRIAQAHRVVVQPDARLAVAQLAAVPADTVVLSEALPHDEAAQVAIEVVNDQADALALNVTADRPTVIVVRDALESGWRAEIDGEPAAFALADGRFRAVSVPPGRHLLAWRFSVPGLRTGLAVSLLAWLAWAGAIVALWRRRRL